MKYWLFHYLDRYIGIPLVLLSRLARRRRAQGNGEPRAVLAIKFSMLGDTVLLIPALRALRRRFPSARITILCSPLNRDLLERCPYVDERIVVDPFALANPLYLALLLGRLRKAGYDRVIDFEQWFRFSALLAFWSGARHSAGFRTPGELRHLLFDTAVAHAKERHEVECYDDILRALGIENDDRSLEVWIPDAEERNAREALGRCSLGDKEFIVVHPGSSHWAQKQWPVERFTALCEQLAVRENLKVAVTGSASERGLVSSVIAGVSDTRNLCSLGGELSVLSLAAVLRRSRLLICGNTGVMHLACAVGAPVVLVNGPVSAGKWGPWSPNSRTVQAPESCAPCVYLGFEYGCSTDRCMRSISVESVLAAVQDALKGKR